MKENKIEIRITRAEMDALNKYAERLNAKKNRTPDMVEVVRCKDCVHWGGVTFGGVCRKFSGIETKIYMGEDRYCSYGERSENERT